MRKVKFWVWALTAVSLGNGACTSTSGGDEGSETHWLKACDSSDECGEGSCICGRCTERCSRVSDCPSPLDRCVTDRAEQPLASCELDAERGLCGSSSDEDPVDVSPADAGERGETDAAPGGVDSGAATTDGGQTDVGPTAAAPSDGGVGESLSPTSDASDEVRWFEQSSLWRWQECGRIPAVQEAPAKTPVFSPQNVGLVVQESGGRLLRYTWPLDDSAPTELRAADGGDDLDVIFSPDGAFLAEVGGQFALRDADSSEVVSSFEIPADCKHRSVAVSEDNLFGLTIDASGSCVLDLITGELAGTIPPSDSVAFTSVGLLAASCPAGAANGSCEAISYESDGTEVARLDLNVPSEWSTVEGGPAVVSPNGERVAAFRRLEGGSLSLVVWSVDDGAVLWTRDVPDTPLLQPVFSPSGDLMLTSEGTFSASSGGLVALGGLAFWDLLQFEPALSPDGQSIATNRLTINDVATGGSRRLLRTHWSTSSVDDLALSLDGNRLVSIAEGVIGWHLADSFEDSLPVWSASTGGPARYVAISPDGYRASLSGDRQQVFDAYNGVVLYTGPTPASVGGSEMCIAFQFEFSPDGRFVAGKRYTPVVQIFDTQTMAVVGGLMTGSCGQGVAFSRDGSLLHTPEGTFSTNDWQPVSELRDLPDAALDGEGFYDVDISSDDAYVLHTACTPAEGCRSSLSGADADLSPLDAEQSWRRRHLSIEGHWVVVGGMALHWQSGTVVTYADGVSSARFATNGDIIAGFENGELARYCRVSASE